MNNYLQAVGYWNLLGSIGMFLLLEESFANKILVKWAKIFTVKFDLGYYGRLWLFWAAGLNVFFAVIHIKAVYWDVVDMKQFLVKADIVIYLIFICLGIWGYKVKKCNSGIFVALFIFVSWALWGVYVMR